MSLTLVPMTEAEYLAWRDLTIPDYAAEKVASGAWPQADALRLAQETVDRLLPQGLATPHHYLRMLCREADSCAVGRLWFAAEGAHAYLYDIFIREDCRGQGWGRAAMKKLEEAVLALGLSSIKLHVFGTNQAAQALYSSLGYETTDLSMRKQLSRPV
jgi:ribosomal protein S18 acetylase RimI-like enzyme